jgi:hypothetical protein
MKANKLIHLENEQKLHKDFMIDIQKKTFSTFSNLKKNVR